ncbi:MAG: glycosyltransferase family 9 protein [Vampirovibrionales bacterium]|nr:glycosyltransferase family 9 protein [Vampirovibrionales bacterium]
MSPPDFALDAPLRILVMRYRFIGDTILTVPFLRNLRRQCPQARIDALLAPGSAEALSACPYLDERLLYDTSRQRAYESPDNRPPQSFWHYVRLLKSRRYDVAFVLKRSFSSALLAALAGIPTRIGFDTEARRWLLTRAVPYRRDRHEADCFLDALQAAGLSVDDGRLEAFVEDDARRAIAARWASEGAEDGPHALIHLTSSNAQKEWPLTLTQDVARWLIETCGYRLHACGSALDAPRYERLREALAPSARARLSNWCGQTTLAQTLALIERVEGVIGVDSGALHLGAALQKPVVGLYTPMTHLEKWAPRVTPRALVTTPSQEEVQRACHACLPSLR